MRFTAVALLAGAAGAMAMPSALEQATGNRPLNVQNKMAEMIKKVDAQRAASSPAGEAQEKLKLHFAKIPNDLGASSLGTNPRASAKGPALPAGVEPSAGCTKCNSSLSFPGNKQAKAFEVGNQIPSLPFKTKTSWAGNINITGSSVTDNPSLFFWLWGKDDTKPSDDLVIWLNGGPGCSSLGGMVQENGPFLYESVLEKPFANPYSWTKGANILYVEQPVKTGFTTGTTKNTNEDEVAEQFSSFLEGFYKAFPELKSKNLYITGESYAGTYIPNIANYIYKNGNKFGLKSGIIIDGVVTAEGNQQDLVVYEYALAYQKTLNLTDSDIAAIKKESDKCNVTTYLDTYLKYPAKGKLPDYNRDCDAWETFYERCAARNPQFNVYNIETADPSKTSPLGNPNGGAAVYLQPTFFDNRDLQTYIHAPHKKWVECAQNVFVGGTDQSPPPDQNPSYEKNILTNVIQSSASPFIIMQGQLDALLITNGTSVALQNLTWNGAQGFQQSPFTHKLVDSDGQDGGTFITERNLTYAIVPKSGHMIPGDAPSVGFASLEVLIGKRTFSG